MIASRDATDGRIVAQPIEVRFASKVRRDGECWEWTAHRFKNGYGSIRHGGRRLLAHRVAWELERGPIPAGLLVLHACDNRACVRIDHLSLGTQAENMRDMDAKGRRVNTPMRGEANPAAKLTAAQVAEIRRAYAPRVVTRAALAEKYGVSKALIEKILAGDLWPVAGYGLLGAARTTGAKTEARA